MDDGAWEHDEESDDGPVKRSWGGGGDLLGAVGLAVAAAVAFALLPAGDAWRFVLALPVLLFVPGYLVLEASSGVQAGRQSRVWHAAFAVGLSPAVVGLLALVTAVWPGGFRPENIVAAVTVACVVLAGLALRRRVRLGQAGTAGAETLAEN